MIPQLKSIFNQNQLTSLVNLLTQTVNTLIAGKEDVANKQNSLAVDATNTKYPTVTAVNAGLALKLNLTGGTMSGAIAMGTAKITGLGTPTTNQDAATKLYVDTAVSVAGNKQDNYDLGNVGNSAVTVTIDALSGVATFTQVLTKKTSAYYQINNTEISAGDFIECNLFYSSTGTGFPFIVNYETIAGRIRLNIANIAIDGGAGADTSADLVVTFRKI